MSKVFQGGGVTIDDALNSSSTNPVQNKVIQAALDDKASITDVEQLRENLNSLQEATDIDSGTALTSVDMEDLYMTTAGLVYVLKAIEFSQMSDKVAAYMTASASYEDGATDTVVGDYADGTQLATPKGYGAGYTGTMSVSGPKSYSYAISNSAILNVVPGTASKVTVTGTSALVTTKLKPTGQVRFLDIGLYNVRDLGGWECDGGTIAYNKIIRGTQMVNTAGTSELISSTGKAVLLNAVGIKAEQNWQESTEDGGYSTSPLGSSIAFNRSPLNIDNGYLGHITGDYLPIFVAGIQWVMQQVAAGNPVYNHCSAGTDRTGVTSAVFEAVLGVAEHDIDRDFELTRLGSPWNTELNRGGVNWLNFKNHLKTYTGDTFRDKVIYWLRVNGVTMDEINAFRTAMVDGTSEILADPYKEVVNLLPISIDTDGSIYNASDTPGYKVGYRLNSSSVEVASTNDTVSGYIAVELGKTYLFEDLYYESTDSSHYIAVFDSSFTKLNNGRIDGIVAGSLWCEPVYNTDATKIVGITPLSTFASASKIAYFRVSQATGRFPGSTTKIYVK